MYARRTSSCRRVGRRFAISRPSGTQRATNIPRRPHLLERESGPGPQVGQAGATPLAATTDGYPEPLREDRPEAVRDGRIGEVESGLPEATHLNPLEERLCEQLTALTTVGGRPRPAEVP